MIIVFSIIVSSFELSRYAARIVSGSNVMNVMARNPRVGLRVQMPHKSLELSRYAARTVSGFKRYSIFMTLLKKD